MVCAAANYVPRPARVHHPNLRGCIEGMVYEQIARGILCRWWGVSESVVTPREVEDGIGVLPSYLADIFHEKARGAVQYGDEYRGTKYEKRLGLTM